MTNSLKYCLIVLLAFYSCATVSTSKTSTIDAYDEDLTIHRPQIESIDTLMNKSIEEKVVEINYPDPSFDVTEELDYVLDSIDRLKENKSFVDGFTIQVYSGISSEEAKIARGRVYSVLQGSAPSLKYDEPNFKVKVGKYFTRLDAQSTFTELKSKFPNAIIIPERIYIQDID